MEFPQKFDCIVVGGGHAGIEAALASGRMGASTLLITHDLDTIGQMSCNPAIGGIGKGHIVREIDALGGAMGQLIDQAGIQWRILNSRKGPAVRASRAQADKTLYKNLARYRVEQQQNVHLFQQGVDDLILENNSVAGVITQSGLSIKAKSVVLTTGTFLGGVIHIGLQQSAGGRAGNAPSIKLAARLRELVNNIGRLKTGTPARLDGRTIDYSILEEQPGESPVPQFSYLPRVGQVPRQISCHIAHTNEKTHDIIRQGLDRSPLYSGVIDSTGPRYCPSIEDKVVRFSDKDSHQIFVEPEGLSTVEVYPNGISTSLPFDVQWNLVRSIKGFENAVIMRPGYAIEYDYLDPRDLLPTLESKLLPGLFLAGQINGTTGYEEAGGQGLIAGLNGAAKALAKSTWYPTRDTSYIGVMIDDLITSGASEPYRMFTSRAEYRLLLREDNADSRLTEIGYRIGVVDKARYQAWQQKSEQIIAEEQRLKNIWFIPHKASGDEATTLLNQPLRKEATALDLLRRPEITYDSLTKLDSVGTSVNNKAISEQVEISVKYAGYIDRQLDEINRLKKNENTVIPPEFDYELVRGLSNEVRQKLVRHRPHNIGQAGRIDGITPAAISLLLIHLKRKGQLGGEAA